MATIERISPLGSVGYLRSTMVRYPFMPIQLDANKKFCELSERPFLSLLSIRGDCEQPLFRGTMQKGLDMALPVIPNTCTIKELKQLLWLGPDEWLYKTRPDRADFMGAGLRNALTGTYHSVVDVSSGYTTLVLKGEAAPLILARGCPLDLHPTAFPTHTVVQSHLAKAAVILVALEAGTYFEITVSRSLAIYLRDWLCAVSDHTP